MNKFLKIYFVVVTIILFCYIVYALASIRRMPELYASATISRLGGGNR